MAGRALRWGVRLLRKRLVGAVTTLVAASLMLTGCGPDYSPRGRLEKAAPVVAVCAQIEAISIEFFVGEDDSNPYDEPPIWKLEGSHVFHVGDTIRLGTVPAGMEAVAMGGEFDPQRDGFAVRIRPSDNSVDPQASWWGAGALSDEHWSNGSSDEPCS
jgi:hypothetical protein